MERTRRAFLGTAGVAASAVLSGCIGGHFNSAAHEVGLLHPAAISSFSTTADNPAVEGQPLVEDGAPATYGAIAHTPTEAKQLIDWGALSPEKGDDPKLPPDLRSFEPNDHCVSAIVGVLPKGYQLEGIREEKSDAHFEGKTLRYEVTQYQSFQPEPNDPEFHYDYSFTLWNLKGIRKPEEVVVNFHEKSSQ